MGDVAPVARVSRGCCECVVAGTGSWLCVSEFPWWRLVGKCEMRPLLRDVVRNARPDW